MAHTLEAHALRPSPPLPPLHTDLDCWFAAKLKMGKAKAFKKWEVRCASGAATLACFNAPTCSHSAHTPHTPFPLPTLEPEQGPEAGAGGVL